MKKGTFNQISSTENKLCKSIPTYESEQLFGEQNEIIIKHQEAAYRLRITRNGKLVMNK